MVTEPRPEHRLDIVTYNKNALNNLRRAIVLGQGQFSLILARVNYRQLRRLLIEELNEALRLIVVDIPPATTGLRDAIVAHMPSQQAIAQLQALMVIGLEEISSPAQLEQLLKAANLGRDELPKTFQTPVVLWVNDTTLQQLNRYAPDLKSFAATPIRFEYPIAALLAVLTTQAGDTFNQVLDGNSLLGFGDISLIEKHLGLSASTLEPLASQELSFALAQIESQEHLVTNEQLADLLFLQGRNLHQQGELVKARSYYESSLSYWQQQARSPDKQAVLLFHLGLWWRAQATLDRISYTSACEQAQQYFEDCLAIFRQQNRPDRLGHFILALAEVLHKLENWSALAAIAQAGTALHASDPVRLARDYGYLAEVALAHYSQDPHPDYLSEAQRYAQQALETSEQATAEPDNFMEQMALRYHRGSYLYLLARAQQLQGKPERAIANLEKARLYTEARYDLSLYRHILDRLWHLYFEHKHYAQAFEIKLAQRRVESLFGLRAFIGASQIQPEPAVTSRSLSGSDAWAAEQVATAEIAAEIKASGRQQDIEALTNRLSQPRYPIVVIHGQSGVGKSSILSAGLIPRLHRLISEGRTTYPVLISSYSRWATQLAKLLEGAAALTRESASELPKGQTNKSEKTPSARRLISQLKAITREKYQQIVLIFDQFEDFFYEYPEIEQRRELYTFLRDCLDVPYVKVVLSLREDFLHYLLEWDRSADLSAVENDILSKEIRYYLGNFMPKAAEMVIRQMTGWAGFFLEDGLITALVDDLAANTGEIRPIELQVVGAQLQRENITTLAAYRQLGRSPKSQLLKNFLDSVIHDCGPENTVVAQSVLYLLSEGAGRPLKSHSEIEEALTFANIASESQQLQLVLDILIGSGLVFEAPEVSGVRYQLVHEYLASLVQQQPPAAIAETSMIEAIQAERSRRQQSESQLEAALAAQSHSLLQTSLADERTQVAEIRSLVSVARSLRLSGNGLGALVKVMRAAKQMNQQIAQGNSSDLLKMQTVLCLDAILREIREKNELSDHNNWVLAVDCCKHPDGNNLIASASDDGTLKLWSHQGELIRTLLGHQAGVVDVRFSPDGQHLASASLDHTIRLWQANGDFIRSIETASASVTSISFSPTEPILAATYSDANVRLWNLSGELVRTLKGHEDWARTVAFSPDGQLLATGGEDQTVRLWRVSGELLHIFHGHQGWVRSVAFSPDGQTILSAGDANTLRLWSRNGRKLKTLYGHDDWVRSLAFSPDGQRIVSGSDDQTIKIWGIEGTIQQTFNQRSSVHSVAWSADGGSVVSGGDDDQVHIWRLAGPPDLICRAHTGIVWSACWQPVENSLIDSSDSADLARDGNRFLSAGGDNTIKLWSGEAALLKSIAGHRRGVHSLVWSPKGDFFASASADHSVRLWTAQGEFVRSLTPHEASVWQVSYSPDGTRLASVSSDRTLRLWTAKGKLLRTFTGHTDTVWHVSFSPDSQHLITASEDNTLRLWHLKKGLIQTLQGHSGGVWCASFSPNGQHLASGGADGVVRLWAVSWQGQQQMRIEPNPLLLKGHRDWVRSLSFSPEGKFLASASDDSTVRLWSLLPEALASLSSVPLGSADSIVSSHFLPPLTGHEGVIWEVDFDATGERLVTASADGTVRVWDLRLSTLMEKGCDWLQDWLLARPEAREQPCTMSQPPVL
ncbi:MAG: AAA family ATPase [Phormidesmis sp.]